MKELICTILKTVTICAIQVSIPANGHEVINFPQGMEKVCIQGTRPRRIETPVGITAQEHVAKCSSKIGFYNNLNGEVTGTVIVELERDW